MNDNAIGIEGSSVYLKEGEEITACLEALAINSEASVTEIAPIIYKGSGKSVKQAILNAQGTPMCGEFDIKTCIAMLIMDRLGIGGSFAEFHPFDFAEDFILVGHDGPHHLKIANGKPVSIVTAVRWLRLITQEAMEAYAEELAAQYE